MSARMMFPGIGLLAMGCLKTPDSPTVFIDPPEAFTTDALTAEVTPTGDYTYQWFMSPSEDSPTLVARKDLSTENVPAETTQKGQTWAVVVTSTTGAGWAPGRSNEVVIQNSPPSLACNWSTSAGEEATGYTTEDDLLVSCQADDLDEEDVDGLPLEYEWSKDSAPIEDLNTKQVSSDSTASGERWAVKVTVSDGEDQASVDLEVTIGNVLPTVWNVRIVVEGDPDSCDFPNCDYRTDSVLRGVCNSDDADGDPVSVTWDWTVDGTSVQDGDSYLLSPDSFIRGDTVIVTATPYDGHGPGLSEDSAAITIGNTPPSVGSILIEPTEIYNGMEVVCHAQDLSDPDGDSATYHWILTVNGLVARDVSNEDEDLGFTEGTFNKHDVLGCSVRADDGIEEGDSASCASHAGSAGLGCVVVLNSYPIGGSVTLAGTGGASPITTSVDVETTVTPPTDADEDTLSESYQWFNQSGAISGADLATLSSSDTARDDEIYVVVTYSDQDTTNEGLVVVTSNTITIENTPPTLTGVTIGPDPVFEGQTLTAGVHSDSATVDPDQDTLTFFYEWFLNTTALGSSTTATLTSDHFDHMDVVHVIVVAFDGYDYSAPVTSNYVTVANTPPEIQSVTWNTPVLDTNIVAEAVVSATDADADGSLLQYSAEWFVDGFSVQTTANVINNTDTLSGSLYFDKSQEVFVTFTANDGTNDSSPWSSSHLIVQNSLPTWSSPAALNPHPANLTDTMTFAETAVDPDGDPITYTVDWDIDGTAAGSSQSLDLTTTAAARGQTVSATITPNDGTGNGPSASPSKVISNAPPSVDTVSLSPDPADTTQDLHLNYAVSDPDNDTLTVTYTWWVDTVQVGETSDTFSSAAHDKDNRVKGLVTVDDGFGATNSLAAASAELTISNASPSTPGVAFTNASSQEGEDLVCQVVTASSDADPSDTVTYLFSWSQDGTAFTGTTFDTTTSSTLGETNTSSSEWWTCTVLASDGTDVSQPAIINVLITKPFLGWNPPAYPLANASYTFNGGLTYEQAGWDIHSAGDIDGDGKDDILIGAYGANDCQPSGTFNNCGRTYLFTAADLASASNQISLGATTATTTFSGSEGNWSGYSISGTGDLDGNGLGDLAIGEPYEAYQSGASSGGAVHLFLGENLSGVSEATLGSYALQGDADYIFYGTTINGLAGYSVDGGGDVDGDGLGDLLIGAPGYNGEAFLVLSSTLSQFTTQQVPLTSVAHRFVETVPGSKTGTSVAFAGDIDGDGLDEVLLGGPYYNDPEEYNGVVHLMLGSDLTTTGTHTLDYYNTQNGQVTSYASATFYLDNGSYIRGLLGKSADGAGDVDGDGYDDLVMGASSHALSGSWTGVGYILLASTLNSTNGPLHATATTAKYGLTNADYQIRGSSNYVKFGIFTSSAGDVDGDGKGDVLIGNESHSSLSAKNGSHLYLGANLVSAGAGTYTHHSTDIRTYSFTETSNWGGYRGRGAGDVNADGLDDLIFGSPGSISHQGRAYLVLTP